MYFYEQPNIKEILASLPFHSRRTIKKLKQVFEQIVEHEKKYASLDDESLRKNTEVFKQRLNKGETLDQLLPEAYATVREACRRLKAKKVVSKFYSKGDNNELILTKKKWDMVPYDVQIIGGMLLHGLGKIEPNKLFRKISEMFVNPKPEKGKIVEMVTGEGKTLTATLPAYLNALTGKGVHIVTTNDYLAQRDKDWMLPLYEFLGVSVGALQETQGITERQQAYNSDITYGSNNQFSFDYLRDNLKTSKEEQVQRGHNFAIIDEADSILIDEARTPHIISEADNISLEEAVNYLKAQKIFFLLQQGTSEVRDDKLVQTGDYYLDFEKQKVNLTEQGILKCKKILGLEEKSSEEYDNSDEEFCTNWLFRIEQAIRANMFYKLGKDYVIQEKIVGFKEENGEIIPLIDKEIIIIDTFTGRLMPGRRWSNGLHEAIEAKENVTIRKSHGTLATITLQNYFKMYDKIAGMTGTAHTSKNEFWQVYNLDTIVLPTNKPLLRTNHEDEIYLTKKAKFKAIKKILTLKHFLGIPIIIGTTSLESSEIFYQYMSTNGIKNIKLLNANPKNARKETEMLSTAGRFGSFMIATNMAGRGADIVLEEGLSEKIGEMFIEYVRYQLEEPWEGGIELSLFEKIKNKLKPETKRSVVLKVYNEEEYKRLLESIKKHGKGLYFQIPKKLNFKKKPAEILVSKEEGVRKSKYTFEMDFETGLYVVGTERHEARRIDNQLRGRTGRQGNPGSSKFYLSLEDDIMKYFPAQKLQKILKTIGVNENEKISSPMVSKSIEKAQNRIEILHAEMRKQALEYDEPIDEVRKWVYEIRQNLLENKKIDNFVINAAEYYYNNIISEKMKEFFNLVNNSHDKWELIDEFFGKKIKLYHFEKRKEKRKKAIKRLVLKKFKGEYMKVKESLTIKKSWELFTKQILELLDNTWKNRLESFDKLIDEVAFVGYSYKEPIIEFKRRLAHDNEKMKKELATNIVSLIEQQYKMIKV